MKKGLILTLATIAITLLCAGGYAYAPIIGNIPDVYIGDAEDNPVGSTVDLNFFRFSNAFNFDKYVSKDANDEDQSTTNVRWSFLADSAGLITINGIDTLADASEAIEPDLVSKELTAWGNNDDPSGAGRATSWATFYDLLDSPIGSGPPWDDPSAQTYSTDQPLDTIITIYASNGVKADSKQIIVAALDDDFDKLSAGIELVWTYDEPVNDGWSKTLAVADGTFINAADGAFYIATHSTDGQSVGAAGHATNSMYGSWQSPKTDIAYANGYVYRANYTIRTNQTDSSKVPNCRLYINAVGDTELACAGGGRVGKGGKTGFPPDADGETYSIYMSPPDLPAEITNLQIQFEVIDFSGDEEGTNYMDEVTVERFEKKSKAEGTLAASWNSSSFGSWTSLVLAAFNTNFGTATCASTASGLQITTPGPYTTNAINYGRWALGAADSGVSFEADRLYRCIYTLAVASAGEQATIGKIRLINSNEGADWSSMLELVSDQIQSHMPTVSGVEYDVYYNTMPALYGDNNDRMDFSFDLSDGKDTQLGTVILQSVELYYYDIP